MLDYQDTVRSNPQHAPRTGGRAFRYAVNELLEYAPDYFGSEWDVIAPEKSEDNLRSYLARFERAEIEEAIEENISEDDWDDILDEAASVGWQRR
jgi:hypothetical protein